MSAADAAERKRPRRTAGDECGRPVCCFCRSAAHEVRFAFLQEGLDALLGVVGVVQHRLGGLDLHEGPDKARDLSIYAADGTYRFNKANLSLQRGWALGLQDEEELRQALDLFYPACLGLFLASREGRLEVQNLRDKLERQTGMYRFAKSISDAGAQKLVRDTCGPDKACAKKILWRIDAATPLEDSPASSYTGIPDGLAETEAIPLLCREACNHFVAECRKAAKAEFEVKNEAG